MQMCIKQLWRAREVLRRQMGLSRAKFQSFFASKSINLRAGDAEAACGFVRAPPNRRPIVGRAR